jgi:hypothetical protein
MARSQGKGKREADCLTGSPANRIGFGRVRRNCKAKFVRPAVSGPQRRGTAPGVAGGAGLPSPPKCAKPAGFAIDKELMKRSLPLKRLSCSLFVRAV